jgi:hypothetical protein
VVDDRDAWRRGVSQMRRVVSTGRRSRALASLAARALGGASNAETSAGVPTGRTCGACGALLSSSTTAKETLARPLRGQSSGSVAVKAAPAVSWHAPDARPLGTVPTQSARHKAWAVGAVPRRRTSGRISGRNTWRLCPGRGKDAAIGRGLAIRGKSRISIAGADRRRGVFGVAREFLPGGLSPAAPGAPRRPASRPARRGARRTARAARARRRAGTRSQSGAGRPQPGRCRTPAGPARRPRAGG